MYKNNQITLKEALEKMVDAYQLKGKIKTVELTTKWHTLVGPMLAKHTTYLQLQAGILVIKFDSAPLKQEVSMMKSRMKQHLNEALGEELIKDIRIL